MQERRWRTAAALAALAVVAGLVTLAPAPAQAQDGGDLVEACEPQAMHEQLDAAIDEVASRACKSLESLVFGSARACRAVEPLQGPMCPTLDGRPIHPQAMDDFEDSWLHRALGLQGQLDLDVPLSQALLPHTHNSANSSAYDPSISNLDANQVLTLTDQLRLGIRAIEIDVHWTQNPAGDPEHDYRAVVQCHGEPIPTDTDAGVLHAGCSVDTLLVDLLHEFRDWLDAPGNENEVVLLYLENALDEDAAAHKAAADAIESTIGDLVAKPVENAGCQSLPVERSKQDLLFAGTRVLITGNCGPGTWTNWVFDRYPSWDESGGSTFNCTAERAAIPNFDSILVRRYEDSTWLSAMAGSGSHRDATTMTAMVRCGVNLVGFDQLHPGDDRLPSLVWSWRTNEPAVDATSRCAAFGDDGDAGEWADFFADDCTVPRPVACRTASGGWAVTTEAVAWTSGDVACQSAGHVEADVPFNGWDSELLQRAAEAAGAPEIWLAYGQDATGAWVTGIPAVDPEPEIPAPGHSGDRPANPPGQGGPPAEPGQGRGKPIANTHALAVDPLALAAVLLAAAVVLLPALRKRRQIP